MIGKSGSFGRSGQNIQFGEVLTLERVKELHLFYRLRIKSVGQLILEFNGGYLRILERERSYEAKVVLSAHLIYLCL